MNFKLSIIILSLLSSYNLLGQDTVYTYNLNQTVKVNTITNITPPNEMPETEPEPTPEPELDIYELNKEYYPNNSESAVWVNTSNTCTISAQTLDYVEFIRGSTTCNIRLNTPILINTGQNFEISFNVRRYTYGSSYISRALIPGIFTWEYHRDSGSKLNWAGINSSISVNVYNNYKFIYENGMINYYLNNNLVNSRVMNYNGTYYFNVQINNGKIRVGNIKIKVYK